MIKNMSLLNGEELEITINGHTGTAKIKWTEGNQYQGPHWYAFITVPYQPSKSDRLSDDPDEKETMLREKALKCLEYRLKRCTLI